MSSIKCGNCKNTHDTVAAVRACYATTRRTSAIAVMITPVGDDAYWDAQIQASERAEDTRVAEYKMNRDATAHRAAYEVLDMRTSAHVDASGVRRENMFGGKCTRCGGWVEAQAGYLSAERNQDGRYDLEHGACPENPAGAPSRGAGAPTTEPVDGIYVVKGDDAVAYSYVDRQDLVPFRQDAIYKVYKMVHGSGRQGVKRLTATVHPYGHALAGSPKGEFEYLGLASKRLPKNAIRMNLEEAAKFGAIYGFCCVCGRTLTKEESIAAGIGPICAGKGWM